MAKGTGSNSEMARARQSDGLNVIFDQNSPASSRSRSHSRLRSRSRSESRSSNDSSRSSSSYRGRDRRRRYYRSSSSSSLSSARSRSSSRSRSRSYPRCHRLSSRCRCDGHRTYRRGYSHRSPPHRYRAHSRSYSRSPDRYSRHRRYRSASRSRSRSRSPIRTSQYRCRFSQSPSRSRSRSRSTGRSVSFSLRDKRDLLEAAKANAMKILRVEKLELPESVKPILSDPEPEKRVRQGSEKTGSQGTEDEPGDVSSPKTSLKGKIAFSINNSVAKPTVVAPPTAKVTSRVDRVESRKPYGQWIPVRSGQSSSARKRT